MSAEFVSWEVAVSRLRADPARAALVCDSYFDLPVLGAARRYHASAEWQAVRAILPPEPGQALDLGAGNGIASYALAADGWRVTALEPDPSTEVGAGAIRSLAAEARLPIQVLEACGESIPLSDASIDVVFARQVLHHAHDLRRLCAECARVLRPGGIIITARDHVISRHADLPAFLARHPLHAAYGGEHAYTRDEYEDALRAAGLTIEQRFGTLDSAINFGPRSEHQLWDELRRRIQTLGPVVGWAAALLRSEAVFHAVCRLVSILDGRPGRLVTYVARKPIRT